MRVSDGERGFPSPAVQGRGGGCVGQGAGVERTYNGSWPGEVVQHPQHEPAAGAAPALPTARSWLGPRGGAPAAEVAPAACQGTGPTEEDTLREAAAPEWDATLKDALKGR